MENEGDKLCIVFIGLLKMIYLWLGEVLIVVCWNYLVRMLFVYLCEIELNWLYNCLMYMDFGFII